MKLYYRWVFSALTAATLLISSGPTTRAQSDGAAGLMPPEVAALFDDIIDIDKLRVLNPLKLTHEQIDQLIATIREWQNKYNKQLADAAVPPIKGIASDIKEVRKKVLAGGAIPKDFDDKVKGLQDKFVERRDKAEFDTVKGLAESVKKILKPEQVATAEKLAKDALTEKGKEPPKIIFFNYYTLTVLIQFPRIIPLLEQMKAAQ